ncbi:MAG: S1 RNA-binding domain-containing protein, partial [Turicibacter sp.]
MSQTNNQLLDIKIDTTSIIEGIVRMVQFDPTIQEYVAWIESNGIKYIIPSSELEIYEIKGQINAYVGRMISFQALYSDHMRQTIFASCKALKQMERDQIIKRLEAGEVFEAKITRLIYFGAYLSIEGIPVMIRNQDFSVDYTTVGDFLEVGDTIRVKFLRINENMKINVQAETKY